MNRHPWFRSAAALYDFDAACFHIGTAWEQEQHEIAETARELGLTVEQYQAILPKD